MNKIYLIPNRSEIETISQLAKEYDCAYEYNDFYEPEVLDDPKKQEEIIEYYAEYRSDFSKDTMHGAFLDITVHSADPLIREVSSLRIRQSMEIAKRMGLRGVVFHTARLAGFRVDYYLENWIRVNHEFFSRLAEDYPNQEIYMENMFDEAPDVMAKLAERMRDVKNFRICLDYAHATLSGCPQKEWVETLAPYIGHMHINDNDLINDLHRPVGTGKIDWKHFDMLMQEQKFDTSILVEIKGYEGQKRSLEYMKEHRIFPLGGE